MVGMIDIKVFELLHPVHNLDSSGARELPIDACYLPDFESSYLQLSKKV